MLQPWDIYRWNQHSLIKDLTNHDPDLRSRIFLVGGGIPPNLPLAPRGITVITQCYHSSHVAALQEKRSYRQLGMGIRKAVSPPVNLMPSCASPRTAISMVSREL